MATGFQTISTAFESLPDGLYSYVLPFLIVFAIVYALLEKLDLFENDAVNGVVAIAFAFFVTASTQFGSFLVSFATPYGLFLIFAIAILMSLQLAMDEQVTEQQWAKYLGAALALGTVYLIYVYAGWQQVFGTIEIPFGVGIDLFTVLVLVGAVGAIYWIINQD